MWQPIGRVLRPTLGLKLGCLVLSSTGLVFLAAFFYDYRVARGIMMKTAEESARNLSRDAVHQIDSVLRRVQQAPAFVARRLEQEDASTNQVHGLLDDVLRMDPDIYGAAVAFEPKAFSADIDSFAPYLYRANGGLRRKDLGTGSYDYVSQDWYIIPRELSQPVWSEPYFDEGGGEAFMCTYSVPFFRKRDGKPVVAGIATSDIKLEHLTGIVSGISIYKSGFAFLLSQNGRFISHPRTNILFRESIFSLADEHGDPQLREIGREMLRGRESLVRNDTLNNGRKSWLYYVPVSASGWTLGVVFPEDEVLADLRNLSREVLWIGAVGFGILLSVIVLLSTRITQPIRVLAKQTCEIAKGNLDARLPVLRRHDEVGELSHSFENMRSALKEYVANLASTVAAKERIESELKIAHNIQRSFLPKKFPPFPDKTEFDIFADLQPAKEVGGDLYDFFLVGESQMFFAIGDVSGKGVPAALFMAVTKTLLKGVAEQHLSPSEVLNRVNVELARDNDASMFVTVFCAILDLRTGELLYTNAGHLPPLLVGAAGGVSQVELPPGLVLGVFDDCQYETKSILLRPGDKLVVYTDGVTEAMNPRHELYSDERLESLVRNSANRQAKPMVETIFASVHEYASTEPQSDDITVLALEYRGRQTAPEG